MQKVLSIEIGLSSTKICEIDYKKKNPRVYRSFIFDTPENVIEDGYIRDKNTFATVLKEKLSLAGFKKRAVVFTIASNKILSREVIIPAVKENRISAVVEAEANEYFPMDISDHILTHTVIEKMDEEKKLRLLVFAAPLNLIKNYYSFSELLGLEVEAIDYIGNSSYQWLKKEANEGTNFILQINEQNTLVTIMKNGVLALQRNINYGTNTLVEAVLEAHIQGVGETAAALDLLCSGNLVNPRLDRSANETYTGFDKREQQLGTVRELVADSMQLFIGNISRVIEYYTAKNKQSSVENIKIVGLGASIQGMDELLSNELGLDVEIMKELAGVTFVGAENIASDSSGKLLSCVGATVAPVNFIPTDLAFEEQKKNYKKFYIGVLSAATILSLMLIVSANVAYNSALKKQKELESKIAENSYIEAYINDFDVLKAGHDELVAMHESTYGYVENYTEFMEELENKLPSGILVSTFTSTGNTFTMSITASSKDMAAKLLLQLKQIPYISEVQISGLTETKNKETMTSEVTFSITCTYATKEEVNQ